MPVPLNSIKYLLFDLNKLEFINNPTDVALEDDPTRQLIVVQVMEDHPALSGSTYSPSEIMNVYRSQEALYKLTASGSSLSILDTEGTVINPGFLSISGGTMAGDLILAHDPLVINEAATKGYVDEQISSIPYEMYFVFSPEQPGVRTGLTTQEQVIWEVRTSFIFPGSSQVGTPSSIKIVAFTTTNLDIGSLRIMDVTNNQVIASVVFSGEFRQIYDMGLITGVPTTEAIWEVQMMTTNNFAHCEAIRITF